MTNHPLPDSEYLFVGGSQDGKRRRVIDGINTVNVPLVRQSDWVLDIFDTRPSYTTEVYTKQRHAQWGYVFVESDYLNRQLQTQAEHQKNHPICPLCVERHFLSRQLEF